VSLIGFASLGCVAYRRQILLLLAPPAVSACLWLGSVPVVPFALVISWLQPLFLIWGLWAAIKVAIALVVFTGIPLGPGRLVRIAVIATPIFWFEASSILAFPYFLGLLVDFLESYCGFKLSWS